MGLTHRLEPIVRQIVLTTHVLLFEPAHCSSATTQEQKEQARHRARCGQGLVQTDARRARQPPDASVSWTFNREGTDRSRLRRSRPQPTYQSSCMPNL